MYFIEFLTSAGNIYSFSVKLMSNLSFDFLANFSIKYKYVPQIHGYEGNWILR